MLDGADTGLDRGANGIGAVSMGQYVGSGRFGLTDRGRQLVPGVLRALQLVRRRGHTPTGHHLDRVGTAAQLFPRRPADPVHAVGDVVDHAEVGATSAARHVLGPTAAVAVPTGLRERSPAHEESRPGNEPTVYRGFHPPVGAAGISHRRVSLVESLPDHGGDLVCEQAGRVFVLLAADLDVERTHVHVRVDQPRHQSATVTVDHVVNADSRRTRQDVLDHAFCDDDGGVERFIAGAGQDTRMLERKTRCCHGVHASLRRERQPAPILASAGE